MLSSKELYRIVYEIKEEMYTTDILVGKNDHYKRKILMWKRDYQQDDKFKLICYYIF